MNGMTTRRFNHPSVSQSHALIPMSNEVIQEKRIYLPNSCLVGELICVKNRPLVLLWYVDTTLILDPFSFPSTTPARVTLIGLAHSSYFLLSSASLD
jgi:hypothetical protein